MTKQPFKVKLAFFLASLWIKSLRIKLKTPDSFSPGILGIWHRDLLAATAAFKNWGVHAFISESGDGEIVATLAQQFGYIVTRGSSSHGASNIRHILSSLVHCGFPKKATAPYGWFQPDMAPISP